MKKYLLSALALPLLFACSSEDYLDQKATDNDQFAGIEKVDATFSMADSPSMRMAKDWTLEEKDVWGFAWMTDDHTPSTGTYTKVITIDGKAYQNHNLIQTDGIFKPQTSIYVGQYYLYRPYDEKTVSPKAIDFKSLEKQPLAEGQASGYGTDVLTPWKGLAKSAINIGDKFTEVTPTGTTVGETTWNKAGIKQHYEINGAMFSNQTGLDLTYQNNEVTFDGTKEIKGATDIKFTPAKGISVGAADIYDGTVKLAGAAKSFTYAPTKEPANGADHKGIFWTDKKYLKTSVGDYFTWADGPEYDVITLKAADENGVKTEGKTTGWFWFNSLPVTQGNATASTAVKTVLNTSYGAVTVESTIKDCAWAYEDRSEELLDFDKRKRVWIQLTDATGETADPTKWDVGAHKTFVNYYGNHTGKFKLDVDFSTGVMNGMHIKNDAHLQKLLKYYIAAGKTETDVVLNLDATDGVFEISKISIALLQTINATTKKVTVQACTTVEHKPAKIIVTQKGSDGKTEVPDLNNVFAVATDVYLASGTNWTWKERTGDNQLTVDANVHSITNEGTLTVNATNIQLTTDAPLVNAAGATMNITKVTTVKNALTNLGTINVGDASNTKAELRAYGVAITNDATTLPAEYLNDPEDEEIGLINNYGVVGVSEGTSGKFNNYGLIDMKDAKAITLLTTNELTSDFDNAFDKSTNKMGTVNLPDGNPTAIVSVNNADANGFIKYTWPATETTYVTPEGNVKYNTIVVSGNIEFTEKETEIQYIEFDGTRTQVINNAYLKSLKGVIVNAGKSIIIEKGNKLIPSNGTFLGAGATVYNGGTFTHNAKVVSGTTVSNYFGNWSTDQIVKY